MINVKQPVAALGAALILTLTMTTASADMAYPADVVRIYVPASPGGSSDAIARIFARYFEKATGASVAIVNQTGGGGIIAVQSVATGTPDGSSLLLYHTALHVSHALGRSPFKFDQLKPLATLSMVNDVYAVQADAPYDSLAELLAYAESHSGKLTIASEFGGTTQLKGQALAATNKNFRVVGAGSEARRITSLLGGQVDVISMSVASAQQFEKAGDIKVLAVLNKKPDSFSPEWPTAISQGVDAHLPQVFTLYGPKRLPAELVRKFDAINSSITRDPAYVEAVQQIKQSPNYRNSAEAAEFLTEEYAAIETRVNQQ
jgi:tripartite-type tricarboxylate transporter receptor subunit TctC